MHSSTLRAAIVDYGFGNVFSVGQGCERAGIRAVVTASASTIASADIVVLPGVGAFGDAMEALRRLDVVGVLKETPARGALLVGVCLGLQLFMTESHEFGSHEGLGLLDGEVVRFPSGREKVPHIGWAKIEASRPWRGTPLSDVSPGSHMYFLHSYYVRPRRSDAVLSVTRYGGTEYCSSVALNNIVGFQFHPERSGPIGLRIYKAIAQMVARSERSHAESRSEIRTS